MTTTVLIILNVFAALAIIVLALMQQSKGDMGSAFGGGGSQSMFGSRGSANFLSRMTSIMCAVFFLSSLSLAYIYAKRAEDSSVVDNTSVLEQVDADAELNSEVPSLDAAPAELSSTDVESEVPSLEVEGVVTESIAAETAEQSAVEESSVEESSVEESSVEESSEIQTSVADGIDVEIKGEKLIEESVNESSDKGQITE